MLTEIKWGMIGAGDVTEVKSGPAFKKVAGSDLVAVMRRDEAKVRDYAARHGIARWYTDAQQLLQDDQVNAVYIATPPDTHLSYARMALEAGKAVYLEKPMTLNSKEANELAALVQEHGGQLVVAHYRREQPYFKKIKSLLEHGAIGEVRLVSLRLYKKPLSDQEMADPKMQWRLNPTQSGGGLFHDLAPHQIDIVYHLFGKVDKVAGMTLNQSQSTGTDDLVGGQILFENKVYFTGTWAFNVQEDVDQCEIIGSKGKLSFSFFDQQPIVLINEQGEQHVRFDRLQHVQQPMIAAVVAYLQGEQGNPCSVADGEEVMRIMDIFTGK